MVKILNVICLIAFVVVISSCGGDAKKTKNKVKKAVKKETAVKKKSNENTKSTKAEKSDEKAERSMTPDQIKKAEEILANVSDSDLKALDGKKLYRVYCATCHGFKGNMKINGAKDLTISKLPQADAVAQMYFGKGLMTPYKNILKEAEIVALSEFITTLRK